MKLPRELFLPYDKNKPWPVEIKGDTRIFSPEMVPGLCVTIVRQLNESKRLEAVHTIAIYRLEQIAANGSGKVVAN
jgi:hypothetical protein